jgi:hypothetical protein
MPEKSDDFKKTLEYQKSNLKELKNQLILIDNKIIKILTVFKILQILGNLLIILVVAYFISMYY